jgi:hypothetical protein
MTNKTKIIIGVGSAVALVGGYFLYKALRPKKPIVKDKNGNVVSTTTTSTTTPSTSTTTPSTNTTTNTSTTTPSTSTTITPTRTSDIKKQYRVNTSVLRVRSEPNTNSEIVAKLSKNCIIDCLPTSVQGWMEFTNWTDDGKCKYNLINGLDENSYVSSQYLTPIN